jgi:uncharacterized membrane protein
MEKPWGFRNRAHEVSRVEAFSDVVFGFALTLIVVSLEVPRTYEELVHALRGFPAFAICFAVLTWIWHSHYSFYRRYGLNDGFTITVNSLLLFVVLFYVYPLKYLFGVVTGEVPGPGNRQAAALLFTLYGVGYAGIFFFFFLLYRHALQKSRELDLNLAEEHDTRTHMAMQCGNIAIGLFSVALAWLLPSRILGLSGLSYFLIGPVMTVIGMARGRDRRRVEALLSAAS